MEQCNCRCRDIFTHSFVCVILQQKVTEVSCCTKGLYNSCVSAGERNKSYVVDSTSHDGMQSNFRKYIYSCCLDLVNAVAHAKMKTPTFLSVSFSYSFCLLSALNLPRHRVLPIDTVIKTNYCHLALSYGQKTEEIGKGKKSRTTILRLIFGVKIEARGSFRSDLSLKIKDNMGVSSLEISSLSGFELLIIRLERARAFRKKNRAFFEPEKSGSSFLLNSR